MAGKRQQITIKVPRDFSLHTRVQHPAEKSPYWRIHKVTFPDRIIGHIMCDSLYARYWHRVGDRTVPCLRPQGIDCLYHGEGAPRSDYQATVPFVFGDSNIINLVNLTMAAVRDCHGLDTRNDLFGCEIVVWRMPGGKRQKMCCRVSAAPKISANPKMKVAHDEISRVLEGIYGYKLEHEAPEPDTVVAQLPLDMLGN